MTTTNTNIFSWLACLVPSKKIVFVPLNQSISKINGFIGLAGPYDFYPFSDDYMYQLFSPENDAAIAPAVFRINVFNASVKKYLWSFLYSIKSLKQEFSKNLYIQNY